MKWIFKECAIIYTCTHARKLSCPTLCNPMDHSLPGSSIHVILQTWILGWVAISSSRGSSRPRDLTWVSRIVGRHFTIWATKEVPQGKGEGGQSDTSASAIFSDSFNLTYSIYQGAIFWGITSRTPSHLMLLLLLLLSTLCDAIDGSPPGSLFPGILKARTLEWVAISFSNAWKWKVKVKSLSCVRLLATPWTAVYQAPPSMGFSRQEYWSGLPLPSPCSLQLFVQNNPPTGSIPRFHYFISVIILRYMFHYFSTLTLLYSWTVCSLISELIWGLPQLHFTYEIILRNIEWVLSVLYINCFVYPDSIPTPFTGLSGYLSDYLFF